MKKLVRDFFDISATERRGVMALVFLILLVQSFRILYPRLRSDSYPLSEAEALRFTEWVIRNDSSLGIRIINEPKKNLQVKIPDVPFNPNTLDRQGWLNLGFSEREAGSALKFISKGGSFSIKSDLSKLYFIDSSEYEVLAPWIDLPNALNASSHSKERDTKLQTKTVELNSADTLTLQSLKGIGPYWARRIVRHRERLGGFYKLDQLLEMKGFSDTMFTHIRPQLRLDTNLIRKLALNSLHDSDLVKHPYCWYGVGKSIVTFRAKHGPFRQAGDLRKIIAIRPEQLERLLPYLKFE